MFYNSLPQIQVRQEGFPFYRLGKSGEGADTVDSFVLSAVISLNAEK